MGNKNIKKEKKKPKAPKKVANSKSEPNLVSIVKKTEPTE